jgi:hypothetical protein
MSESIVPFSRVVNQRDDKAHMPWLLRLMRLHIALVGVVLLVLALGLFGYLYDDELRRIDVDAGLRFSRSGDVYEEEIQVQLLLALLLGLASLFYLRTVSQVTRRVRQALWSLRVATVLLLAGFPAAVWLWHATIDIPGLPVNTVQLALRAVAVVLVIQSVLAAIHGVWLWTPAAHRALPVRNDTGHPALRRMQTGAIGLWLLVVLGLGIVLGVLTDWVYELPVSRPEPGKMLYATTFDSFNNEWDTYEGRDSALVVPADALELGEAGESLPLAGDLLVIGHEAPITFELVFSTLDRKFNDFDLRVTTQQVSGPEDNQYGVLFRYRDLENYYAFLISGDGYYALVKMKDGVLEFVSNWGLTDITRQGVASNEIRVVALQDTFQFWVNGQLMPLCLRGENLTSMWDESQGPGACMTDELAYVYQDDDFEQGRIALAAGSSADLSSAIVVGFDDLLIVGPQPDAIIESVED